MYTPDKEEILNFIRESNAIEGIFEDDTHPLVRDHITAIDCAIATLQEGNLPTYLNIHRMLLVSEPAKTPGMYRQVLVRVGSYTAPNPELIPRLMADHWDTVLRGTKQQDIAQWIWDMHCEFESIHPFIDGNGRVGRIVMNALRLWHELPWLIIYAEDRQGYYRRITDYRYRNKINR